jgi:hypothetical protein
MTNAESIEDRVSRLVGEYAEHLPPQRPLDIKLSLRKDLAIESLSLVSLTLRFGDELGVDVVGLGIELGKVETLGDLINLGHSLVQAKSNQ